MSVAAIVNCSFNPCAAFLLPVSQSPSPCLSCLQLRDLCSDIAALTEVGWRRDKAGWDFIDHVRLAVVDSFDRVWLQLWAVSTPVRPCITFPITFLTHFLCGSLSPPPLSQLVCNSVCFESQLGKYLAKRDRQCCLRTRWISRRIFCIYPFTCYRIFIWCVCTVLRTNSVSESLSNCLVLNNNCCLGDAWWDFILVNIKCWQFHFGTNLFEWHSRYLSCKVWVFLLLYTGIWAKIKRKGINKLPLTQLEHLTKTLVSETNVQWSICLQC